jgi:dihydroxyacetone kinase
MVTVDEDCAVTSSDKTAGRRGLVGTILILKVCDLYKQNPNFQFCKRYETKRALITDLATT